MENKNNKGLIIIIIVLILCLLGSIFYIVYDKVVKKEEIQTEEKERNNENISNEENDNSVDNSAEVGSKFDYNDYYNIVSSKEKYYSLEEENDIGDDLRLGVSSLIIDSSNKLIISEYTNSTKGKSLESKYGKNYILSENVLNVYILNYGNAGAKAIIVLNGDGTLKALTGSKISSSSIDFVKIDDLKEIVNVYTKPIYMETPAGKFINGSNITALDINGSEHNIDSYLN